ncbi:putative spermidine/putrescine transport system substrate-binding protein [Bradyrhizobium sp. GM24.11]
MIGTRFRVSRRTFLIGTAGVLSAPMITKGVKAAAGAVTFTVSGGSLQDNFVKYVFEPFTAETGIAVNVVPTPDLAKIKAQILTGNVEWDIYYGAASWAAAGAKQGFWAPLDRSLLNAGDLVVPPQADWVSPTLYAGGIAWNPARHGAGKHPETFAELFDVKMFPGRRAFPNYPNGNLEMALLADGVAPKDLYPLDLSRAFKSLDRIKTSVATWFPATPQAVSLLQTGEIDFAYTFNNRIKATNDPNGGVPLAMSFKQNLVITDGAAVLKGSRNKENALKLISFLMRPDIQAKFAAHAGLAPVSKEASAKMSDQDRKWHPDLANPNNVSVDASYWAEHLEEVARRFKEWVLT